MIFLVWIMGFINMINKNKNTDLDVLYEGLDFSPRELIKLMKNAYKDLLKYVEQPQFLDFYKKLMDLDPKERPNFVKIRLFTKDGLDNLNLQPPDGILIQTSSFGDRRPTLFAVKKMMPQKYQLVWENMNITFNNEFTTDDFPINSKSGWRAPLPVGVQNGLISKGIHPDSLPDDLGVNFGIYEKK